MAKPSVQEIDELKKVYPELYLFEHNARFTFVVKRPIPLEVNNLMGAGEGKRPIIMANMAKSMVVWPADEQYDEIAQKYPVIPMNIAGFGIELASANEEAEAKKA